MPRKQTFTLKVKESRTSLDVLRVSREESDDVEIVTGRLESQVSAEIAEVDEKLVLPPYDARWLRDRLNAMDLED